MAKIRHRLQHKNITETGVDSSSFDLPNLETESKMHSSTHDAHHDFAQVPTHSSQNTTSENMFVAQAYSSDMAIEPQVNLGDQIWLASSSTVSLTSRHFWVGSSVASLKAGAFHDSSKAS
jgi:hypothetical protein